MKQAETLEKELRCREKAALLFKLYEEIVTDLANALWKKLQDLVDRKEITWTEVSLSTSLQYNALMRENRRIRAGDSKSVPIEIIVRLSLYMIMEHDAQWFVDAIQKKKELLP